MKLLLKKVLYIFLVLGVLLSILYVLHVLTNESSLPSILPTPLVTKPPLSSLNIQPAHYMTSMPPTRPAAAIPIQIAPTAVSSVAAVPIQVAPAAALNVPPIMPAKVMMPQTIGPTLAAVKQTYMPSMTPNPTGQMVVTVLNGADTSKVNSLSTSSPLLPINGTLASTMQTKMQGMKLPTNLPGQT